MKLKAIIGCVLVVAMLTVATPVLALSLGVSPTHIELEVPGGGSATVDLQIHYFDGDVNISLIDIPLRVEPSTVHVDASNEPVAIELIIYGNHSLETQVYDGYIRFIAVSGGAATGGVQVIAKVTNIADGIAPLEEPVAEEPVAEEPAEEEGPVVEEPTVEQQEEPPLDTTQPEAASSEGSSFPVLPVAGIAAGTIIIITLIVVIARRYQY